MLASPIRIDRAVEADIGRVVVRDDRARSLDGDLRLERTLVFLFRRPAIVEGFARDRLEASLHEGTRAAHMQRVLAGVSLLSSLAIACGPRMGRMPS